jgi:dolichol-phosphate mannosyltransferase
MAAKMTYQDEIRKEHKVWEFPDFEALELQAKKNKYCVCIFVINEGERIQKQLKAMKKYAKQIDIVVADGGSTDGSLEKEFLKTQNVRALLTKKGKGKLSAQMRMAFAWALQEGYKGVVVVDGNGKDDISAIPDFIKKLDEGYDHIQGSRFIPGGKAINTPLSRELGLHLLHAPLISLASRKRHTDTTNGFRGYSARLLSDIDVSVFRDIFQTYELHYYLAIESSRRKEYKTIETPVTRAYPKKGKTPTKISPVKGNLHVLGVLFRAVAGKYKPAK